ncbi:uncharacterized protein N7483_000489 [Penicillium malachiteum]|uniref:uncharacterized protein n=1 Tax=Penicillium malachiteum TaxID=1324776 RepID=UPI0025497871|nr:uncharacterized protein N7483_000489 [Penicillium malachiteum]KAJ5735364.1 hypothetical protein N7483_000489 [Penicillium malachiteum]
MYATQALLAMVFAASAVLAAPTPTSTATSDWTIENLTRDCNDAETSCTWTFGIFDGTTETACTYIVAGPTASGAATCGDYTVTSNYAQGNPPWTQFSVIKDGLIIYPSYTDDVLANPPVADWTSAPVPTP